MAVGDLWRIIDRQLLSAQQCLNVYFYEEMTSPTEGTPADALTVAFIQSIEAVIKNFQSSSCLHFQYEVTNLDDPDQFGTFSNATTGTVASEALPPFVAWAFRLDRASRLVRNGQKRIPGVPESLQVNGEPTSAALALLNLGAVALGGDISAIAPNGSWRPRIAHRLGTVPETYTPYAIAGASYSAISSQNTRKFGRGI